MLHAPCPAALAVPSSAPPELLVPAVPQVMTEPQLVQRSEAFEAAIRGGDREALAAFCADMEQRVGGVPMGWGGG